MRQPIDEIQSSFDQIFDFVEQSGGIAGLELHGEKTFSVEARRARDGRRFLEFPHGNRAYEGDWGFYYNSMGKDGQRIGHYSKALEAYYRSSLAG